MAFFFNLNKSKAVKMRSKSRLLAIGGAGILGLALFGYYVFGGQAVAGMYVNSRNSADFVELKPDGTYTGSQGGSLFSGTYDTESGVVVIHLPTGTAQRCKISGGTITDPGALTWQKQ